MPLLNLEALETDLGAASPILEAVLTIEYLNGRSRPFTEVNGERVILPKTIRVDIVDGAPVEDVDALPTPEGCYARVTVQAKTGARAQYYRKVLIPAVPGPIDFGNLEQVDPATLLPYPDAPTAQQVLAAAESAVSDAEDAAALSGSSAFSAGASAAAAQGSEDAAEAIAASIGSIAAARRVHIIDASGQSNMSGRGANYSSFKDPAVGRIFQFPGRGASSHTLIPATEPLVMHDTATGIGPALQFARLWLEELPEDDIIVIVPNAHGGTPLSSNVTPLSWRWGVSGNLSAQAVALTLAAKAAAQAAWPYAVVSIDGVLWFQGETDSTAGTATPRATYEADLDALIAGYRTSYGNSSLPFIVYRMIPEALGVGTRNAIDASHQNTPYRVARTGVVPSIAGKSNGDALHANAEQHRLNAPVAFAEFKRVRSGRAPVFPDAPVVTEPGIGSRIWIDTATRADDTNIAGDSTETGGYAWVYANSATGGTRLGIISNELAGIYTTPTGSTIIYTVDNNATSYWLRAVITAFNQYMRLGIKIVDPLNYLVAYMTSDTQIIVRRYDAGTSSDLGTFTVASGAHEIHGGWLEDADHSGGRLLVRHNGVTLLDTHLTGFGSVENSGFVLAGNAGIAAARVSEIESLVLVP